MTPEIFANLRSVLASLYSDETSIRRVMADAGLSSANIIFSATVINIWFLILDQAAKGNQVDSLLTIAEHDYGDNLELQNACINYRKAIHQTRYSVTTAEATIKQKVQSDPQPIREPARPYPPIINHDGAIQQFRQLLQPKVQYRFIHLQGDGEMGKTTLLAKVFPILAEHSSVYYAAIDMRNSAQSPVDIIHTICSQLGDELFPHFAQAYSELLNQQRATIQISRSMAIFSKIDIINHPVDDNKGDLGTLHLTSNFIEDLRSMRERLIVFLFDTVDQASTVTQNWLLNDLLGRLRPLLHLRVVVAGRRLPEASSSYSATCRPYKLSPVFDMEAYIRYCREIGARLDEQNIRLLAQNTGYIPGAFANTAKLFVPQGQNND